ncbi:MAG: cytochrome c biogenesis protein CcdC [Gemmatimonadetes bacterium]|nr:cytochrome c biogenesis protein CcdC [Gemmatimonadota bacterium]
MQGALTALPAPVKLLFALAPVVGGVAVLIWRWHETRTPVTVRKIVLPPLGMATGFCMFFAPQMRVPWTWGSSAFVLGAVLLAIPLIRSSSLERVGDVVMMRRSQGFLLILFGLLALRIALHEWVGRFMSPTQTAALFYLLAFGMIVRWRAGMYFAYRALVDEPEEPGVERQVMPF